MANQKPLGCISFEKRAFCGLTGNVIFFKKKCCNLSRLVVQGSEFSEIIFTNRRDDWAQCSGSRRFQPVFYFFCNVTLKPSARGAQFV